MTRVVRRTATQTLLLLFAVLAAVALAGCGGSSGDTASPGTTATTAGASAVTLVTPEQAQKVIDAGGVTLLDVRTPEEFAAGHIAGAQNIDFYAADFADRIAALDSSTAYVVYCHSGNRSGQATAMMARDGFTDVTDVDGGIAAWEGAGLPVVTGS
jgi:phage shock protein E